MNLIHAMKKLGYIGVNDDGMCYGIAAMSASAIVRGEGDKYIERIKMIKSFLIPHKAKLTRIL